MKKTKKKPSHQKKTKSPPKMKTAVIVLSVAAVLIAACIVALIIINMPPESSGASATQDTAVATTVSVPVTAATSGQIVPSASSEADATQELSATASMESVTQALSEAAETVGMTAVDLPGQQLAVVDSDDSGATITFYEKKEGVWEQLEDMTAFSAFVGRQGVSTDANEYDDYTPFGIYALGTGFGIKENPGTAMPYFQVTPESYWVDDPESRFYNQHVEGTEDSDWGSAEHLIDYEPSYNYALEIRYNTDPVVPGKGSAFFMHIGSAPTAGCVAMPEENMLQLLRWLDPEKEPYVIII